MTATTQEWVVVVSGTEDGEGFSFIATEGFESRDDAESFICDNATAYAEGWLVEVVTREEAEQIDG